MTKLLQFSSLSLLAGSLFLTGCDLDSESSTDQLLEEIQTGSQAAEAAAGEGTEAVTSAATPTNVSLPQNPALNSSSSTQQYSFTYKAYDDTYRPRWPTYFATNLGIGPGSFTTLDGDRADFRSYDVDNGAKRPSYTIPGYGGSRYSGEVLAILFTAAGEPVAWFSAPPTTRLAPLPL